MSADFLFALVPALAITKTSAEGKSSNLNIFSVADIRCEDLIDPIGIDISKPRFSWKMVSGNNGAAQTAYQILCATDPILLKKGRTNLWDSGKVISSQNRYISYAGKKITRGMPCYWAVRVWNEAGEASPRSKPAMWTYAGLASNKDWQAKWIHLSREKAKVDSTTSPWL